MVLRRDERKQQLIEEGWREMVSTGSGLDTYVLERGNEVVRLGTDEGYDAYADVVTGYRSTPVDPHLPRIFAHERPAGPLTNEVPMSSGANPPPVPYTETTLERLLPLDPDEAAAIDRWLASEGLRNISTAPHGLAATITALKAYLDENQSRQIGWDLQSKNAMKREDGTVVLIDPFC